ncbi:MAG: RibD family protein [Ferruginibacter sp.]
MLESEALELNKAFFTFHQQQRPYIILKWAQSSDKKIGAAGNERIFISNDIVNRLVHQWRSETASILVGTNTALKDDPALTTRLVSGKNPVRLVIDRQLKLPKALQLFDGTVKTMVFNEQKDAAGDMISYFKTDSNNITSMLDILYRQQIQSVLVEGGAKLLQFFIDAGLWDEARVITNLDLVIGEGVDAPVLSLLHANSSLQLGNNRVDYFLNDKL